MKIVAYSLITLSALLIPRIYSAAFGDVIWEYETGDSVVSSPRVDSDGNVYFGSIDGRVYSIDGDGMLRWSYDTTDWVESSPSLSRDESTVYVGSWSNKLVALDAVTGDLIWEFVTSSLVYASPAVAEDGSIYFGSSDGFLYALNSNGTLKWELEVGGELDSSPAIDDAGIVYVGANEGKVCAIEPDGEVLWSTETPSEFGAFSRDIGFISSPLITATGKVIIGCQNHYVYCMDSSDGTIEWKFETDGIIEGSCVEGMGRSCLVSGRDGYLYSLDWDGNLNWKVEVGENYYSSPCVDGMGRIYVGSVDGNGDKFIAVYSSDGIKRWETQVGSFVDSSPTIGLNGVLYVGNNDNKLYAIQGADHLANLGWPSFGGSGAKGWASLESYDDLSGVESSYYFNSMEGPLTSQIGFIHGDLVVEGGGAVKVAIRGLSEELMSADFDPKVVLKSEGKLLSETENELLEPWADETIRGWLEPGSYRLEVFHEGPEGTDAFAEVRGL
ncbi:MAG: PQQ-binding-like beta-propeller repeat protein [Verrucomicrobiota bacterium]